MKLHRFLGLLGYFAFAAACTMEASIMELDGKDAEVDPLKIVLSSDQSSVEVNEGSSTAVVLVFSKAVPKDTTIDWSIADAGNDFQISSGTVDVAKGASSARFQINSLGDAVYEGNENFSLVISGHQTVFVEAITLPLVLSESLAAPVIKVSDLTAAVHEDAGTHEIILEMSTAASIDSKITFVLSGTATNGVDYTAPSSLDVTIAAGSTSVAIPFAILDDANLEGPKTLVLALSTVAEGFGSIAPTEKVHTLTITDNDTGVFAIRGVIGGSDETKDAFLVSGSEATIAWDRGTGDTGYALGIYEADGSTVKCAVVPLANSVSSHAFAGCALTEGLTYVATIVAGHADGDKTESLTFMVDTQAPVAGLTGAPSGTSYATSLNIDVDGVGVTGYSYKVGPSLSTDCSSEAGYGGSVDASVNITNDLSSFGSGSLKVCAIGVDAAGNWQSYASATSATWDQAVATVSLSFASATQSVNEPTGWQKRMKLLFDNSAQSQTLTDFPVLVTLDSTKVDYSEFLYGGADLYFADSNGNQLSHQIEKWDTSGTSYIWVKVPSIAANSSADFIWMYYKNGNASVAQDAAGVWSNGYSSVFHLGESTAEDSLGNATSTVTGGSVNSSGLIGSAFEFNGTNQYVDTGIFPDNSFRTLEAWVFYSSTPSGSFGTHDLSDRRFYLGALNSSSIRGAIGSGHEAPAVTTAAGSWYYLVVSGNGSSGRVYQNGVALGSGFSYSFSGVSTESVTIGARNSSSTDSFVGGLMDEVRISTVQRSASWIAAQYKSMTGSFISYDSPEAIAPASVDVTVVASLSEAHTSDITVSYTVSGSADSGPDHNLTNGSLTFAAGETSKSFTFQVLDDLVVEHPEDVVMTMGSPGPGIILADPSVHTLTINDTDSLVDIQDLRVSEGWETLSLSFDDPDPTMGYEVFYNTTGSVTTADTMVTSASDPAILTGLTAGTTYYMKARKLKNGLRSDLSAEVSGTPRAHLCSTGSPGTDCTVTSSTTLAAGDTLFIDGDLTIGDGSTPTELAGPAAEPVVIRVTGNLTIKAGSSIAANAEIHAANVIVESGALISANGRGYAGGVPVRGQGQGPGGTVGDSSDTSGAGHGGAGGADNDSSAGITYGSVTEPVTYGSGAGASFDVAGGNGGGAIKIVASNSITLNGVISSDGFDGTRINYYPSGGGAGGSIWLQSPNLLGSGQIHADGGAGAYYSSSSSGGGGGGRISVEVSATWSKTISVSVLGGSASKPAMPGAEGTYHLSLPSPDLLCDSGSLSSGGCVIASNRQIPRDWNLNGVELTVSNGAAFTAVGQGIGAWNFSGDLHIAGSWVGDLTNLTAANIDVAGTWSGAVPNLTSGNFSVSGVWTGNVTDLVATNLTISGTMNANIANSTLTDVAILSTGLLSANGRGHSGGTDPSGQGQGPGGTVGESSDTSGAGHGGAGGADNDSSAGVTYGSVTEPVTYGSGAGGVHNSNGGNGGGAIKLVATSSITVDGAISADGNNGVVVSSYAPGGGAGGSIWLQAATLLGSGQIHAKGGAGATSSYASAGGGGGGRISVEVSTSWSSTLAVSVLGGSASRPATPGAEGTYHLSLPSSDLLCDTGSLASGGCVVSSSKHIPRDWNISGIDLTIANGATVAAIGQGSSIWNFSGDINIGGSLSGDLSSLDAANLDVSGSWTGDISNLTTGTFVVSGTWAGNVPTLTAGDLSVSGTWTGDVTDLVATNLTISGTMNANIANSSLTDVAILSTGLLSANGRGHSGGTYPSGLGQGLGGTAGDNGDTSGAGHGGVGGADNDSSAGVTYGSVTAPVSYGSGAGAVTSGDGANGGGAIKIVASNSITLDGAISADGADGFHAGTYGPGGGAGGSIWLQTPSLLGSGDIHADGGSGDDFSSNKGGGGGGGRISVEVSATWSKSISVSVLGGSAIKPAQPGAEGSYHLSIPSLDALCDTGSFASGGCVISTNRQIPRDYNLSGIDFTVASGAALTTVGQGTSAWNFSGDVNIVGSWSGDLSSLSAANLYVSGTWTGQVPTLTVGDFLISGTWTGDVGNLVATNLTVSGTMNANIADSSLTNLAVQSTGLLSANGRGYSGGVFPNGQGQGSGGTVGQISDTSGAGHGGAGGGDDDSSGGGTYGSVTAPVAYGSGSGAVSDGDGANGGGAIKIVASNSITLDGAISADGAVGNNPGTSAPGGGAGGSIWLQTANLLGSGDIHANGGAGDNFSSNKGGGGGGGRISVEISATWSKTTSVSVLGGSAIRPAQPGAEGSYHLSIPSLDALCDTGSFASGGCVISSNRHIPRDWNLSGIDLTIASGAIVTPVGQGASFWNFSGDVNIAGSWSGNLSSLDAANLEVSGAWIGTIPTLATGNFLISGTWNGDIADLVATNLTISGSMYSNLANSVLTNLDVQSTGVLSANGRGYAGGLAPNGPGQGPGGTVGESSDTSGAGHGGVGGADNDLIGGASYGSSIAPVTYGSGSGAVNSRDGASGGGAIKVVATNSITVDGAISADGSNGASSVYGAGGGAGGSIWLQTASLLGSGQITAKGGAGANDYYDGGGGAGGRIALYHPGAFTNYSVDGGWGYNSVNGSTGTFFESAGAAPHLMFVSSAKSSGAFGGISGADAMCASTANAAGIAGRWLAVMSDSGGTSAVDLSITGPVYNMRHDVDGGPVKLADDATTLWDGTLDAPVGYTEAGAVSTDTVWTGTIADGTASTDQCSNWSSTAATGTIGDATVANSTWIEGVTPASCTEEHAVYCLLQ